MNLFNHVLSKFFKFKGWPSVCGGDDVVSCVVKVVIDVVIVVICVCCDGGIHGEVLVILVLVAGCTLYCGALVVLCVMVRRLWLMLLMLW